VTGTSGYDGQAAWERILTCRSTFWAFSIPVFEVLNEYTDFFDRSMSLNIASRLFVNAAPHSVMP